MGIEKLILSQIGVESTFNTPVTVTREMVGDMSFDLEPERVEREEFRASMGGSTGHDDLSFLVTGRYDARATVRELPYFLSSSVRGDPTISTPSGGTNSRQWLYKQPVRGDGAPALKSLTAITGDNSQALQTSGITVNQWVLTGNDSQQWRFTSQLMGANQISDSVAYQTITEPTGNALADLSTAINKRSRVFIDDTGAGIGGTRLQLTGYGFTFTWNSGTAPDNTMDYIDDATALYMNGIQRGGPTATLELLLKWNASAKGEWDKFRANTRRFVRIENVGSIIEGSINRLIRIDGAYDILRYATRESKQDGTVRARMSLTAVEDRTWAKKTEFAVINTATAL
jgi:hypothetical protein